MRKQFVKTVEDLLVRDEKSVLLLGDIGVFGFRNAFTNFPERVYNIGILEQATIGLAAGMAMSGFTPIVHTIAPFLVERCYEQLKLDFCYQKLGGNFVSVGASYDYAALGCTHHCPGDVPILKNIPGMEIVVPGHPDEFDLLFKQSYSDGHPTYYRLSERSNRIAQEVSFGKATVIKQGGLATVLAIGTMLDWVVAATEDLDVTVLYYSTLSPFDVATLKENSSSHKILICEPYYGGSVLQEIHATHEGQPLLIDSICVPLNFLTNYGTSEEHDNAIGFNSDNIRARLLKLINP